MFHRLPYATGSAGSRIWPRHEARCGVLAALLTAACGMRLFDDVGYPCVTDANCPEGQICCERHCHFNCWGGDGAADETGDGSPTDTDENPTDTDQIPTACEPNPGQVLDPGPLLLTGTDIYGLETAARAFSSVCVQESGRLNVCSGTADLTTSGGLVIGGRGAGAWAHRGAAADFELFLHGATTSPIFVLLDAESSTPRVTLDFPNAAVTITAYGSNIVSVAGTAASLLVSIPDHLVTGSLETTSGGMVFNCNGLTATGIIISPGSIVFGPASSTPLTSPTCP
jgi:hypothetical protein